MPVIVVPDDEPAVLAGTTEEKRLRQLGEVHIYNSRALGDEELLPLFCMVKPLTSTQPAER